MSNRVSPSRPLLLVAFLVTVAACSDESTVAPEVDEVAQSTAGSGQTQLLDLNERMALMADRLPGYAGHFYD